MSEDMTPQKDDPKKSLKDLLTEMKKGLASAKESFDRSAPLFRQLEKMRKADALTYSSIEFMNHLKLEGLDLKGRSLSRKSLSANTRYSAN